MIDYGTLIEKLNSISLDGFTVILDKVIDLLNDNEINFYEALSMLVDNQIKVKKAKVNQAKFQNMILQYFKDQVFRSNKLKVEEDNE